MRLIRIQGTNTLVCVVAKNGSNTIRAMIDGPRWHPETGIQGFEIIAFVRPPHERLVSAWRHFVSNDNWPVRGFSASTSFPEFIDGILDWGVKDQHWNPQVTEFQGLPTQYYHFRDMGRVLSELTGKPALHKNSSPPLPVDSEYRRAEILEFYADDYNLLDKIGDN